MAVTDPEARVAANIARDDPLVDAVGRVLQRALDETLEHMDIAETVHWDEDDIRWWRHEAYEALAALVADLGCTLTASDGTEWTP